MTKLYKKTKNEIAEVANALKEGDIIAIATETVYGLAGDATNESAVHKIYAAKQRPAVNPLIVHVSSTKQIERFAVINETAQKLMDAFWPGALTIILDLKNSHSIAPSVTAGLKTIAVRMPNHETFLAVSKTLDKPLAAPSANLSEHLSPTCSTHVLKTLNGKIDGILEDDDACLVGIESTIIDTTVSPPAILRPGGITQEEIKNILPTIHHCSDDTAIKAPGQMKRHYSPQCSLRTNATSIDADEVLLCFGKTSLTSKHKTLNLSKRGDLKEAMHNLFDALHVLEDFVEKKNLKGIAITPIPDIGLGKSINDRLRRAENIKE